MRARGGWRVLGQRAFTSPPSVWPTNPGTMLKRAEFNHSKQIKSNILIKFNYYFCNVF